MKRLIFLVLYFQVLTCPVFAQNEKLNDPRVFEKLDEYLKPVSIKRKLPTPDRVLGIDKPESVHGKVRYVIDEKYVIENEKDPGMKLPGLTKEYWFDNSGKLIRSKFADVFRPGEKKYFYNTDGQIKKIITTYKDGKVDSTVYNYDGNGLMRDRKIYIEGKLWFRTVINYDALSRPTVEYGIAPYGPHVNSLKYYYSGIASMPDSVKPVTADIHTFRYEKGVLVTENWIDPKTRRLSFRKRYNDKGELIEEYSSSFTRYKYTYDSKGNWTKKLEISELSTGGYSYGCIRRKIEY